MTVVSKEKEFLGALLALILESARVALAPCGYTTEPRKEFSIPRSWWKAPRFRLCRGEELP